MSILKVICDDCGKELEKNEVYIDYDHVHRCYGCDLKNKLYLAENDYQGTKEWLKKTWLKDLAKKKSERDRLRNELNK